MTAEDRPQPGVGALAGDEFSVSTAIGGWRGFVESALPGVVYVTAFVVAGGYRVPVIASVSVLVVLVAVRLLQRTPVTQALGGAVGVGIGAIVAWRSGSASDYYVPGFLYNGAAVLALLISMVVRWPLVGIVIGFLRGTGTAWRQERGSMRAAQIGTAVFVLLFAVRLAVQVPLYLVDEVAALGVAKLVLGVPAFVLALWATWLLVRNVGRPTAPPGPPPATK